VTGLASFGAFNRVGRRTTAAYAAFEQHKRAADAAIQARLAAERQADINGAPREVSNFGFPTDAQPQGAEEISPEMKAATETEAEEAKSRFNHLEL
jgi:hypothetical protein